MKTLLNYIGQLRIYSLIDLALLFVAVEAAGEEFIGALFLHIGFLDYLESKHSHEGRMAMPKWSWIPVTFIGVLFFHKWETAPFLVCSYLYARKNQGIWGLWSPFFRGLQYFFLLAGIAGYGNYLPWIALLVVVIRNTIGDIRDVRKDMKEGMRTLPIAIGIRKDLKYGHLVTIVFSSTIWWNFSCLSVWTLLWAILAQIATYKLTPR